MYLQSHFYYFVNRISCWNHIFNFKLIISFYGMFTNIRKALPIFYFYSILYFLLSAIQQNELS